MKKITKVLMSGGGGYGYYYLKAIFEDFANESIEVCGLIDPFFEELEIYPIIKSKHIPCFRNMNEFFAMGRKADLVIISSPIQYHVEQAVMAMQNGCNVLCDKPMTARSKDAKYLMEVEKQYGKWCMIGYQWSFSSGIQNLKKKIIEGELGKAQRFKTLVLWPRDYNYYQRNSWAGKIKTQHGDWVLDSPLNNAMAHFIHNLFFLGGKTMEESAIPRNVEFSCYRAYSIESYDTVALRAFTEQNCEICFYGSHTSKECIHPIFELEFEKGLVVYNNPDKGIQLFKEGIMKESLDSPDKDLQFKKVLAAVERCRGDGALYCGTETAYSQTQITNFIFDSGSDIANAPKELIVEQDNRRWVEGQGPLFVSSYEQWKMPYEMPGFWMKKTGFFEGD